MSHFLTWFGGCGGFGSKAGLHDLRGFFPALIFYDFTKDQVSFLTIKKSGQEEHLHWLSWWRWSVEQAMSSEKLCFEVLFSCNATPKCHNWWGIEENALACIVGLFFWNTWIFGACLPRTSMLLKENNYNIWIIHWMEMQIIKWGGLRKRESSFKSHTIFHFSLTTVPTQSFINPWQLQVDNQQISTWAQLMRLAELITERWKLLQFHYFEHHRLMHPKRLQLQGFYKLCVNLGNSKITTYEIPTHLPL